MNAIVKPVNAVEVRFEAMTPVSLESVIEIEQIAYEHPWTHGNFMDSLNAGYQAQLLMGGAELLGYFVAMMGPDEAHLLNITVAPAYQGCGWARVMLDALALWARGQRAQWLWLEVRVSNQRAKAIYQRYGFREIGLRRNYYPAGGKGQAPREDAAVMCFAL